MMNTPHDVWPSPKAATREPVTTEPDDASPLPILDAVELGRDSEHITLRSGRRYELAAGDEADRIVVRSASGRVLLRVAVTDAGPLLSFESAEITLSARNRLALSAPEVSLTAKALRVHAGASEELIEGNRHTHVRGEDRLEAGAVAMQASHGSVAVRAAAHIALDGEHIGLNDDPCPTPFDWTELARDARDPEEQEP